MKYYLSVFFCFLSCTLSAQADSSNATTNSPSITDWIGAIGVLLGVPLTVYGILNLFKKDRKREAEVQSLKDMVISIQNQTKELIKQNRLIADELRLKENLSKAIYKPEFVIENDAASTQISKRGFSITFKNVGQSAIVRMISNEQNFERFTWNNELGLKNPKINSGDSFFLTAFYLDYLRKIEKHGENGENTEIFDFAWRTPQDKIAFNIEYVDMIGNNYYQRVYRNDKNKFDVPFRIGSPVEKVQ